MTLNPRQFAERWAAAWNARDLEAVLAHFEDTVTFSTPKALETVGHPTVTGTSALRAYWERALGGIASLHFAVSRTIWDPARNELGIIYDREVNGNRDRALELLKFGSGGKIVSAEVFYGVIPVA